MTGPQQVTEEQIAAAQLRLLLDEKQGRTTPDVVRRIANSLPGDEVDGTKSQSTGETRLMREITVGANDAMPYGEALAPSDRAPYVDEREAIRERRRSRQGAADLEARRAAGIDIEGIQFDVVTLSSSSWPIVLLPHDAAISQGAPVESAAEVLREAMRLYRERDVDS